MTISEYLLRYRGFAAEPGIGHVVVARNDGPAMVLVGSPQDSPGTSVTNALEQVAAEISTEILGGARDFQLYQYEPVGLPDLKPTFYKIVWASQAFRMPQWVPVTPENEARLAPLAEVLPQPGEYKLADLRRRPGLKSIEPEEPGGPVTPELTIGELFPADDVVAHWVFTLTALAEDLTAVTALARQVTSEEPDIRIGLQYMRQLVTRLYEARRLIEVTDAEPKVSEFIDRIAGERNTWLAFLQQVYGPQQES